MQACLSLNSESRKRYSGGVTQSTEPVDSPMRLEGMREIRCLVHEAYGPSTVTHRYPFAAKSLTVIPIEYPSEGKSFAQVVQVAPKPIAETTNSPIFIF